MVRVLHDRYTQEQLERLPQYRRLMALYESLRPLLPTTQGEVTVTPIAEAKKRSGVNVDFMGEQCRMCQNVSQTSG
jgi:hypothetical protein